MNIDETGEVGVSWVLSASPVVGKFTEIIPRAKHACFDKNNLFVRSVKYTSWRVVSIDPDCDFPLMCKGKAPMMFIPSLFAAFIFIVTGIQCELLWPI